MRIRPLFSVHCRSRSILHANKHKNVKRWVMNAIAEEDQRTDTQLWEDEPSVEFQLNERLRRIRLLRKYECKRTADRLESCGRNDRCCSGACPECGHLLQRWFVRKSKLLIRDEIDKPGYTLVALSIIPFWSTTRPGNLQTLDRTNAQRRLKYALDRAGIRALIGGVDFSFNEDRDGRYRPFWSAHFYLITSVANERGIKRQLRKIFKPAPGIPRPIKVPGFDNTAKRRSYAFKIVFKRRVGIFEENRRDGRKCRNTSWQKLRSVECCELLMYLDQVGLHERFIFRGVEPSTKGPKVRIKLIPHGRGHIRH